MRTNINAPRVFIFFLTLNPNPNFFFFFFLISLNLILFCKRKKKNKEAKHLILLRVERRFPLLDFGVALLFAHTVLVVLDLLDLLGSLGLAIGVGTDGLVCLLNGLLDGVGVDAILEVVGKLLLVHVLALLLQVLHVLLDVRRKDHAAVHVGVVLLGVVPM